MLGHLEELLGRVQDAIDPVRASREGDVAVGIDHPWDDGRASRVDYMDVRREDPLIGRGTNPNDVMILHEDAHALL